MAYLFANVPAHARKAGTCTNSKGEKKYVAVVEIEGVYKRADALAMGVEVEAYRAANCTWTAPASKAEHGYFERHFAERAKRDAWVDKVNAVKRAGAKAQAQEEPAKKSTKKTADTRAKAKRVYTADELRAMSMDELFAVLRG